MDPIRFGRGIRALRQRRGWRQQDLAGAAGVSRSVVWRAERGRADRVPVRTLDKLANALDARVSVRLEWHGQELDRLLDRSHADMVEALVARLGALGWDTATEVTFNEYGERGSIDVLAFWPGSGALLVVEVKTVVPDIGPMLMVLDRKARLSAGIARARGWHGRSVSRLLVILDGPTARRHVAHLSATFATAFPIRAIPLRRWLRDPAGPMSGLWFLSTAHDASGIKPARQAIRVRKHDSHTGSSRTEHDTSS